MKILSPANTIDHSEVALILVHSEPHIRSIEDVQGPTDLLEKRACIRQKVGELVSLFPFAHIKDQNQGSMRESRQQKPQLRVEGQDGDFLARVNAKQHFKGIN